MDTKIKVLTLNKKLIKQMRIEYSWKLVDFLETTILGWVDREVFGKYCMHDYLVCETGENEYKLYAIQSHKIKDEIQEELGLHPIKQIFVI